MTIGHDLGFVLKKKTARRIMSYIVVINVYHVCLICLHKNAFIKVFFNFKAFFIDKNKNTDE